MAMMLMKNSQPVRDSHTQKPTSQSSPTELLAWLNSNPHLEQLIEAFPAEWECASQEFSNMAQSGKSQKLNEAAILAKKTAQTWISRIHKSRSNPQVIEAYLGEEVN